MKGVTEVSGLREIRSLHSTGKRSIPRVQSSAYLDLYMLEKERLVQEAALLEKRSRAIGKRLGDIQRQTEVLEKSARREVNGGGGEGGFRKGRSGRKWKSMALNY